MPLNVLVASANPVKIASARKGFGLVFPEQAFEFSGKSVASNVPDQPVGSDQTLEGALNRIRNLKKKHNYSDYYVGIEGGIRKKGVDWYAFAWIAVESKDGLTGKAQTGHFMLPPPVVRLLDEGYELGDADDVVFGTSNSKQKSGAVGILTDNIIDRAQYYMHAMVLALIPFIKPGLYKQ